VKVRSYLRYKGLAHEWLPRNAHAGEFDRYAKLPLIPLLVTADGDALQDSTPIIERLEAAHPTPSIHPTDPALAFLSALIEEYADEWGNKPMFHYRWFYEADQRSAGERLARESMPQADAETVGRVTDAIRERMVPRLRFVGSTAETRPVIEGSFHRQLRLVEAHLAGRSFLFGERPALGDFGLAAQLYQCATDPTPGRLIRDTAPRTAAWIARMLDPRAAGDFEPWTRLEPTLLPFLRDEVGALFFPWTLANATALGRGEKQLSVTLDGRPFAQETQKYHAKSLAALRARYAAVADRRGLDTILRAADCWTALQPG
jgi:glutathione S-transferase